MSLKRHMLIPLYTTILGTLFVVATSIDVKIAFIICGLFGTYVLLNNK